MSDVERRNNDLVTRLADRRCTRRQDDIGVELMRGGGRHTSLTCVGPKQCSLTPTCGRNGKIEQPSRRDEVVQTEKRSGRIDARQLSADFVVRNLGYDDDDSPRYQPVHPETTLIGQGSSRPPARMAERAGVEQDELPHDSVASFEQRPMRPHLINPSHPFLIRGIVRVRGNLSDLGQPTAHRLDVLAMLFLGHVANLAIGSQT